MVKSLVALSLISIVALVALLIKPEIIIAPLNGGSVSIQGTFTGSGSLPVSGVKKTSDIGGYLQGSITK